MADPLPTRVDTLEKAERRARLKIDTYLVRQEAAETNLRRFVERLVAAESALAQLHACVDAHLTEHAQAGLDPARNT